MRRFAFLFLGGLLFCGRVEAMEIFLVNGDRITGEVIHANADAYIIQTELMGTISVPYANVDPRSGLSAKDIPSAPAETEPAGAEKEKKWSGEISAGFDRRRGNTNTTEMDAGFKVKRKTEKNEFDIKWNSSYGEEELKMNARKHKGMIRYAYSFGKTLKWYNFYKVEGDHDFSANIEYRVTPSTGIGYWFSDREDFKAMVEVGVGTTSTRYIDRENSDTTEIVGVPRVYLEKALWLNSRIFEDFTLYPSLTKRTYRYLSETAFENALTEKLKLRFSLVDEFNSDPGDDTNKHDLRIISKLLYAF